MPSVTPRSRSVWVWLALALIVLLAAGIRSRLLGMPLDRDEGEYAYFGQLMLEGVPPYALAYNMKLPGTYAAYALIMSVLGQSIIAIHLGLMLVNAATTLLVFLLARRAIDDVAGVAAAAIFAVLSLGPEIQGFAAKAEHFVTLSAVGGLLLLLRATDDDGRWGLFGGGVLLGFAFVTKQQGLAFGLAGFAYLIVLAFARPAYDLKQAVSRLAILAAGLALPYLVTCALLYIAGVFPRFWLWTVEYAQSYSSRIPLKHAWTYLGFSAPKALAAGPLLWLTSGVGVTAIAWYPLARSRAWFLVLTALACVLAIVPGFYFRAHYYLMLLPAASLFGGLAVAAVAGQLSRIRLAPLAAAVPMAFLALALVVTLALQWNFFFRMDPTEASRYIYKYNPFPEAVVIGDYLRRNSDDRARVAVLGSEPQIFFYSRRRSATGYIYMYPLMEDHDQALSMQEEMIREIEAARPEFMVFVHIDISWLQYSTSRERIFEWFEKYQQSGYEQVGLIDLLPKETRYHWAPELLWPPVSDNWIAVLQRVE